MKSRYYQGFFKPRNPNKYRGDPTNIFFRSLWEKKYMNFLDTRSDILFWASEEMHVLYKHPMDGKAHRYFPDFVVETKDKTFMVEVKPFKQTQEPNKERKKTKRYITEVKTYLIKSAKWQAAQRYCKEREWEFVLITEKELNIKY